MDDKKNILVISGGGTKGFSALGLLHKLTENELLNNIDTYLGTSVGGMICLLLLIGYKPNEIHSILCNIDFSSIIDFTTINDKLLDRVEFGLYSQDNIVFIILKFLQAKNISPNITFKELHEKFNKTLILTGTCLNDLSLCYFSHLTHENMKVIKALKITSCVPFFFTPVSFNNSLWVDGGCLLNYPISYFDDKLEQVIGIFLDDSYEHIKKFDSIFDYVFRVLKCIAKSHSNNCDKYKKYTIYVNSGMFLNFSMNIDDKNTLFNLGYNTTYEHIFNKQES